MLVLRRLRQEELPNIDLSDRTLGALQLGPNTLYTVEKPWVPSEEGPGGTPFKSCVPPGVYDLVWRDSPSKGRRLHIVNEELGVYLELTPSMPKGSRYSCMFHSANYARQVEGCIGPGNAISYFGAKEKVGVTASRVAVARLEEYITDHNETVLEII